MARILQKLKEGLILDLKFKEKSTYPILGVCFFISLLILLSFFWNGFVLFALIMAATSLFFIKGIRRIYILLFLLPFYNVIKLTPNGFVLSSILMFITAILLAIEYLIDLIKKKKQLNYIVTGLFAMLCVYLILPFGQFDILTLSRVLLTLAVLYLTYVNKEELDFKSLVMVFAAGLMLACLFEPFRFCSLRLESFLPDFFAYVGNSKRFSGLTADPNYFAVEIILVIALIAQLYLTGEIKVISYPLLIFFTSIGFLTVSKSYMLVFAIFIVLLSINFVIRAIKKDKKEMLKTVGIIGCICIAVIIVFPYVISSIARFNNNIQIKIFLAGGNGLWDDAYNNDGLNGKLNSITTGRTDIWKLYLYQITSSLKVFLFGNGIGASLIKTNHGETAAHNFYIEILYHLGIVGALIMTALVVYLFCKIKSRKRFINFVPSVCVAIMLCSLNSLISYRPYLLIILLASSLAFQRDTNKLTNEDKIKIMINDNNQVKEEKFLSIIIPIYNVENYLEKCVNSICQQTLINTEILLIDDGTKDKSGQIAEDLAKKYENIKVYHKENGGLSDARNYGIKRAKGKYLLFIDSDDYVDENFTDIYNHLNDNVDVILVGMSVEYLNGSKIVKYDNNKTIYKKEEVVLDCLKVCTKRNSAWSKIIRREFLLENNLFFQDGFSEDFNWWGRVCCHLNTAKITTLVYYHYIAEREGSLMNTFSKSKLYDIVEHSRSILDELNTVKLNKKTCKRIKEYIGFNVLSIFRNINKAPKENQEEIAKLLKDNYDLVKYQKPIVMKLFLIVVKLLGVQKAYRLIK